MPHHSTPDIFAFLVVASCVVNTLERMESSVGVRSGKRRAFAVGMRGKKDTGVYAEIFESGSGRWKKASQRAPH